MNTVTKDVISKHLSDVMQRVITRRVDEPTNDASVLLSNPFGFRLVPLEVWKGAKFERSFVTTLGQGIFEQLAKMIAEGTGATATNQYSETFNICTWQLEKIDIILKGLRENTRTPAWDQEVLEVKALSNDRFESVSVKSDLHILRQDNTEEFYSFKTVKPNLDQTERAKRDMLRLIACNNRYKAYFALPFNPAGEGNSYRSSGFTIPYKILNFDHDECVLIGAKLWNQIGADSNTYIELLEIFEDVGRKFSPIIKKDYLGL
jgi:hypothetical protein